MPVEEVLPPGVGRVPLWWMEITPHYVLDEDDIGERRKAEDQMAFYYMQLAAAAEAGVLLPDGTPKLGQDLKPLSWTPITPWNRLDAGSNGEGTTGLGPGGRNFKPGHAVLDPKLFGIMENDPDYQSYLTGAKLPPGYFEKMGELAQSELGGTEGILNNLKQTDYGRYGRQAEAPSFKPAWAKKKLRSTETGGRIRQGQYNDSPNKFINKQLRRVGDSDLVPQLPASTATTASFRTSTSASPAEDLTSNHPVTSIHDQIKSLRLDSDDAQQQPPLMESESVAAPAIGDVSNAADEGVYAKKTMVRKVRKVRKSESTPTSAFTSEKVVDSSDPEISVESFDADTSLAQQRAELASLKEQQEKLQRLQVLQRQQQLLQEQQEKQRLRQEEQVTKMVVPESAVTSTEDDEASYEEEILEDDYSEASYEEEVIYDDEDDDETGNLELNDLHAILAAKQAELQRLTQQLQ